MTSAITWVSTLALAVALQTPPSLRVLDKGDQSNMDDARQAVARTASEWNALSRARSSAAEGRPVARDGRRRIHGHAADRRVCD
jgi:hypothetical protein